MKTLYILNNPQLFNQCSSAMNEEDALLLIENAVLLSDQLEPRPNYFVLEEDLIARGLNNNMEWQTKNYEGFVQMTLDCDKSVSWL